MKYPNAYKGITKIFASEILKIAISVLTLLSFTLLSSFFNESASSGMLTGTVISVLAVSALAIIELIIYLIGLQQARKDGHEFHLALIMTVIALALQIVSMLFALRNPLISEWTGFAYDIVGLIAFESVVTGIVCFAKELGDGAIVSIGGKMRILVTVIWIAVIAAKLLEFVSGAISENVENIVSILETIDHILYMVILFKARKMLRV